MPYRVSDISSVMCAARTGRERLSVTNGAALLRAAPAQDPYWLDAGGDSRPPHDLTHFSLLL